MQKAGPGYANPDKAVQDEVRNVAHAVVKAVAELRSGRLQASQPSLSRPRPK